MHYFTNVSFANIYRKPSFHSEVDTQSILWENLETSEKIDSFWYVRTEDGYDGWINENQVTCCNKPNAEWKMVSVLHEHIFEHPDKTSAIVRQLGAGSHLPIIEKQKEWFRIILPDETEGWVIANTFKPMPEFNRENFVQIAKKFLGITYIWGGKTSFGLDCSGYVQLLFKLFGKPLRRDAWMQFEDAAFISNDPLTAQKGDLYFFAENGEKITHLGIALGNGKIIHARGMVKINSLLESDPDFDPLLLKDFVEVRSYF